MKQGKLEIHSENILPIIKKWLYSDKDIFARELVSNACDAIHKVKILRDQGKTTAKDEEFHIEITIDKEGKTLTFADTGIGMNADEIKEYIAQIAFSGAEAFVEQYRTHDEKDQFIGHFGLGFYSTYMVADKVEINSLSYKEGAEATFWSCDGSPEYTMDKGNRDKRGTTITLHVSEDSEEFLDEGRIRSILHNYCHFLPIPISLNGNKINEKEPLWIKASSECSKEDYLEFYRHLYPLQPDPLFWVHLNVDYPFHLKGILYFPKLQKNFDLNKSSIQLYCNRVFVSDNCKDVIPSYLMALQGVIDSPDIPLNVSRSCLQSDRTVRQLGSHISKKVCDSLSSLYKSDRNRFIASWEDISIIVKLGAVEDDKFYNRVKDFLIWKTTDGEWITADEYTERFGDKTQNKILYTADEKHHTDLINMYREKGIGILCAGSYIDNYVINHLEKHLTPVTFQRIDAAMDDSLIDTSREKSILDAEGKTEASKIADFYRKKLAIDSLEVEAKSLATDTLPAFILIDESQRRMRDYMQAMNQESVDMIQKKTMVVNTNSPLIEAIRKLDTKDSELSQEMAEEVYELALLSQREMQPERLNTFIKRTNTILEKLTTNLDRQ